MQIRDAHRSDAPAIAAIWNAIIRDTVITFNPVERSADDIAEMIAVRQAAGHAVMLAQADGAVLGFGTYAQFRNGLGYARTMEHTLYLAPAAQRRGVGRVLLQALEVHAAQAGHHVMVAGISQENAGGIAFHAAMGYRETGRMREVGWKFGRYHDLVLMQKFLCAK